VAQKKVNKIKQKIQNKKRQPTSNDKVENQKRLGRGALQRQKKRARKEAGEDGVDKATEVLVPSSKKSDDKVVMPKEKKPKMVKPQRKRKVDKDDDALEDMIRSYKLSFSRGGLLADEEAIAEVRSATKPIVSSEKTAKRRWFE
jgi:hypothetical protein